MSVQSSSVVRPWFSDIWESIRSQTIIIIVVIINFIGIVGLATIQPANNALWSEGGYNFITSIDNYVSCKYCYCGEFFLSFFFVRSRDFERTCVRLIIALSRSAASYGKKSITFHYQSATWLTSNHRRAMWTANNDIPIRIDMLNSKSRSWDWLFTVASWCLNGKELFSNSNNAELFHFE